MALLCRSFRSLAPFASSRLLAFAPRQVHLISHWELCRRPERGPKRAVPLSQFSATGASCNAEPVQQDLPDAETVGWGEKQWN